MIKYLSRTLKPSLAYHQVVGSRTPGVLFFSGFMSNMNGQKALALEKWCRQNDHSYVRFDYRGTGSSSGSVTGLGEWIEDAADVMSELTCGPQIIIGSSMGAFIMLHMAKKFGSSITGMIGVAPSFFFLDTLKSWKVKALSENNVSEGNNSIMYGEWPVPKTIFDNLDTLELFSKSDKYDLPCQMRIIHGMLDDVVPWHKSVEFVETKLNDTEHDVILTIRKNGDHRLSTDDDLKLLINALECLISEPRSQL